jgi:ectoine hydroxylase-related dioxygenase (phytanoyl-CoA dioxygenase family)
MNVKDEEVRLKFAARGTVSRMRSDWNSLALEYLKDFGFAVVEDVLSQEFIEETRTAMYEVQRRIKMEIGEEKLKRAGEVGVLRLMMKYHAHFYKFLEITEMLHIIDATLTSAAILHVQNGFILPSFAEKSAPSVFQNSFHMDFRRVLNGYSASVNAMFAIDDFSENNGATLVVPGSHQRLNPPSLEYMNAAAIPVLCKAGSMILFDSTLWHAAGPNFSGRDRLAVNQQFTRAFFKQQVDYPRALGERAITRLSDRSQQLLGWYSRVPIGLDEYYVSSEARLYRSGQG